jgi:hypothetical protein
MLDLPEKVDEFDYGLKLALKHMNDDVNSNRWILYIIILFIFQSRFLIFNTAVFNSFRRLTSKILTEEKLGILKFYKLGKLKTFLMVFIDHFFKYLLSSQEDGPTNNVKEVSTNLNVNIKPNVDKPKIEIPEDAFLMVTQMNWEDDVIWNGEDIKHKVRFVVHKKFEPS